MYFSFYLFGFNVYVSKLNLNSVEIEYLKSIYDLNKKPK